VISPLPTEHKASTRHKHLCHAIRGIRTRNPSSQTSAALRVRTHVHRTGIERLAEPSIWRCATYCKLFHHPVYIYTNVKKSPHLAASVGWIESLSAGFVWSCSEWRHCHNLAARHPSYVATWQHKVARCIWVGRVSNFGPDTACVNWSADMYMSYRWVSVWWKVTWQRHTHEERDTTL